MICSSRTDASWTAQAALPIERGEFTGQTPGKVIRGFED